MVDSEPSSVIYNQSNDRLRFACTQLQNSQISVHLVVHNRSSLLVCSTMPAVHICEYMGRISASWPQKPMNNILIRSVFNPYLCIVETRAFLLNRDNKPLPSEPTCIRHNSTSLHGLPGAIQNLTLFFLTGAKGASKIREWSDGMA